MERRKTLLAVELERVGLREYAFDLRVANERGSIREALGRAQGHLGGIFRWASRTDTYSEATRVYGAARAAADELQHALVMSYREDARALQQEAVTLPPPAETTTLDLAKDEFDVEAATVPGGRA